MEIDLFESVIIISQKINVIKLNDRMIFMNTKKYINARSSSIILEDWIFMLIQ
jgi:hypothetical protein